MTDDAFLFDQTVGPTLPVAASVARLRRALNAAATDLLAIPDSALEAGWVWRDDEADVRYGLYRCFEAVEETAGEIERRLRETGARRPAAAERIAPSTVARWALHGLLVTLDDATLDQHPGGGEWTARETLGHIVSGQRAYSWFTAWWANRPADAATPDAIPGSVVEAAGLPEDDVEGAGSVAQIRARLDAILDLGAGRLWHLDDGALGRPARWAGIPVTIGFRMGRWSSHLVEHTLQLDKAMTMLRRDPTEVARIVRLIHAAYGRLEATVFPIDEAPLAVADDRGRTVNDALDELARDLVNDARSARKAAEA